MFIFLNNRAEAKKESEKVRLFIDVSGHDRVYALELVGHAQQVSFDLSI